MSLNLNSKNTFFVFDDFGMLIVPSDQSWEKRSWWKKLWDKILKREWIPTWSNKSWMDSLGQTIMAGLAYGFTQEMIEAIESCYRNGILYRHPNHDVVASRDHHSYFLIYRKHTGQEIPKFKFMRGLYLWMHSLTGNRLAEWMYFNVYIPGAILGNVWLKFCRWTGRIGPERSNEWWVDKEVLYAEGLFLALDEANGWKLQNNRTKWQKLWAWVIFQTIPAYPLHNRGWQLFVMPESKRKERLKKILLKRVGKSNLLLRLLFEPKVIYNADYLKSSYKLVTQEEVDSYPNMTGFRPGVYLDETCRRTIREMTTEESQFNAYERGLILWLWKQGFPCNNCANKEEGHEDYCEFAWDDYNYGKSIWDCLGAK